MTEIPLKPRPATRPRFAKGRAYNDADYERWLDSAAWLMRSELSETVGPVAVEIVVGDTSFDISVEPCERLRPKGLRGDIDNYAKACLDAAVRAGIMSDDSLVQSLTVRFG